MRGEIYPQITQMGADSEMPENIGANLWMENGFEEVGV
ncbi:MAG: hypothetical protein RLZZ408_1861 [Verrucomicrobiota bacterium]|jgi:hypothetical protein